MSTNEVISTGRHRRRRNSEVFKAEAIGACQQSGVSIAAVALARGLKGNMLRHWVRLARARVRHDVARADEVIRVDAAWFAVEPLNMRGGVDKALARGVDVFGEARAHHAYLIDTGCGMEEIGMKQFSKQLSATRRAALLIFALGLSAASHGQSETIAQTEAVKINYLIGTIGSLKDAQFMRNGTGFSATEAVAHLRYKWRAAGSHVLTARDFIREVASKSSVSGAPYVIVFADGRKVSTAEFLQQQLVEYESNH